jgi:glutaredoxin
MGEATSVEKFYSLLRGAHVFAPLVVASMLYVTPAEAACGKSVVLYNAYWCPYCRQVRSLLGRYHIRYLLVEATTPRGQSLMLGRFGDTSVPRTIIGGVVVVGYDPERIKQLLCLN